VLLSTHIPLGTLNIHSYITTARAKQNCELYSRTVFIVLQKMVVLMGHITQLIIHVVV